MFLSTAINQYKNQQDSGFKMKQIKIYLLIKNLGQKIIHAHIIKKLILKKKYEKFIN